MTHIVLDLEWNGAFSKKAHGYFNEIIEIGAVKLSDEMEPTDTFRVVIRPIISKKLSRIVTGMTGITPEELSDEGVSFDEAMQALSDFFGTDASMLTWSNTDLMVLIENYRLFYQLDTIPFVTTYADVQPYCQRRLGADTSQQMSLANACELAGVSDDGMEHHRALDDSRMTAALLKKVYEPVSFRQILRPVDDAFYQRLAYKPTYIREIRDPAVDQKQLRFDCPLCGHALRRKKAWSYHNRAFCNELVCPQCDKVFAARVQYKRTYDGVESTRKIHEKLPKPVVKNTEKGDENNG